MTDQSLCEVVVLLDRSGSMVSLKSDMEGGFESFLAEQRKLPGRCLLTLVQFDSEGIDTVHEAKPIQDVPPMVLEPRGSTPLLDALGRTIQRTGERLKNISEARRPGRVVFLVLTDGHENASREFTKDQVKTMVEHQRAAYHWDFIYLGANVDAFDEAGSMGFATASSSTYAGTPAGALAAYRVASASVGRARQGLSTDLTDEERESLK